MPKDIQYTKLLGPQVEITMTNGPDYEGTYAGGTTYAAGDVVTYNGSSYKLDKQQQVTHLVTPHIGKL